MPVKSTAAARSRSCKPPTSNPVTRNRWPAAILLLVTFLVYIPTLRFQFVYDDMHQVVGNSYIQSWTYLPDYFTKHVWSQSESYNVRYYRPLFLVWLRLNHALFGLEPAYWHLATVAAHALATLLVYVLVRSLLCEWTTALLAALFFGLHPVHVEVAAWVSAASEALLAAALLGSLIWYGSRERGRLRTAGSLALYAVALLLKETAIVFPALILCFTCLFPAGETAHHKRARGAFRQTLPFLLLAVTYLIVRWTVLQGIVKSTTPLGLGSILLTIPSVLLLYGRLLLWPTGLSPFYNVPLVQQPGMANFLLPLLAVVAAAGLLA